MLIYFTFTSSHDRCSGWLMTDQVRAILADDAIAFVDAIEGDPADAINMYRTDLTTSHGRVSVVDRGTWDQRTWTSSAHSLRYRIDRHRDYDPRLRPATTTRDYDSMHRSI